MGLALIGRRSFLAGILGAAAAPAIVKAESLMKIVVPQQRLYTGELGVISDGFGYVVFINQSHEMLVRKSLLMHDDLAVRLKEFSTSRPIPEPSGETVKFRRYAGPILVPSSPLHYLLNGDRKAS